MSNKTYRILVIITAEPGRYAPYERLFEKGFYVEAPLDCLRQLDIERSVGNLYGEALIEIGLIEAQKEKGTD